MDKNLYDLMDWAAIEEITYSECDGSLTATDSLYKPQTLIKTGFQSYFFVNLLSILCSYL